MPPKLLFNANEARGRELLSLCCVVQALQRQKIIQIFYIVNFLQSAFIFPNVSVSVSSMYQYQYQTCISLFTNQLLPVSREYPGVLSLISFPKEL